ncbi:DNA primase small subunit domain-containing protein [Paenibacillus sp. L3-i20]|uniref:DNA primase small subunit domain-containing protein n=1 Tax=Paenibacillus sp. L3-i20 TaxID=2905833 RepID=UPI001EDFF0F9|nr:DNA primase small subunit domain-containing protein [Paenibacillus sp. L3-i20]GKU79326.1 hypothetical protein L3i20_v237230 [Paenibacillus sp. L3-i20]
MAREPQITDYKFVDAWHTNDSGQPVPWTRVEYPEGVRKYQQEEANNFNCFCTVQRYTSKSRGARGESFIAPLYFDLDYKSDPAVSQADAVKLIEFFMNELEIQETDIHLYFSGSKGFHILIDFQALDIRPGTELHKVYKHIAGYLVHRLGLRALDLVVYTSSRMLRLPNSIHSGTKLFKIELSIDELRSKTLDEIKGMANGPRLYPVLDPAQRKAARDMRPKAVLFYEDKEKEWREAAATSVKKFAEEFNFRKNKPPVCVTDILTGGWKKDGDRNQATVQLAAYYKEAGHPKEEALKLLEEWVRKHTSAGSKYDAEQRVANTRSVVEAVYDKENGYKFGCAFIRALHGEKIPGSQDYDRVACAGALCDCLKKSTNDDSKSVSLHLAHTGDAELHGKLVKTQVMVAGKKHTPYIVPSKIEYYCWGRKDCKKTHCPLYDIPSHTLFKDLGIGDPELLEMTATGKDNITGILRTISGIPACNKYNTEISETTNVEELLVIPMAESNSTDAEEGKGRYVMRKAYAIGKSDVTENKYYEITGHVFPHPKNQEATILVKEARPLQDVVDSFMLNDGVKESLEALRPASYTAAAIEAKLAAICADLTYNVTKIVERDETLLAVLLTYHSVLRFNVPWTSLPIRGWLELKIVGDTGTGKSELIEGIRKFTGLGNRVNAESTSRTGLTYKMEQSGSAGAWYIVWGVWPLSDKELIWIDEDTGIEKENYGEMTLARSDGRLEVKKAVTAETPCRVRAILSGNPPKGRRLASYGQGVEVLRDIFNNEDIRRFDFAVFMRMNDVSAEEYTRQLPTYPSFVNSETLKNSILFAWSRKPEHVIFNADTIDRILEVATELSKIYGNASDVPLVSPSDQRNKIARLSVALAALTHSVDESGERIVVWPGHVDFIREYLKSLYNAPGCGLNYYAKLAIREEELDDEKYGKITQKLRELSTLKGDLAYYKFVKLFAQQQYLRQNDVEAMLAIEKEEGKAIIALLANMRMIQQTSGGYRKTARFNAFIAKLFEEGLFDNMDDDDL